MSRKNRQGRLFSPVGYYQGNPDALSPDNWLRDQSRGPVVFHATNDESLARFDDPPEDTGVDNARFAIPLEADERPRRNYGYGTGMHFGTLAAADRIADQPGGKNFIHAARLDPESVARERPGIMDSPPGRPKFDVPGGRRRASLFSDNAANFSPDVDDLVHDGQSVPYMNESETHAHGSPPQSRVSWRTKPYNVSSWSDDVKERQASGRRVRPEYLLAAEQGYEPTLEVDPPLPPLPAHFTKEQRYAERPDNASGPTETMRAAARSLGRSLGVLSSDQLSMLTPLVDGSTGRSIGEYATAEDAWAASRAMERSDVRPEHGQTLAKRALHDEISRRSGVEPDSINAGRSPFGNNQFEGDLDSTVGNAMLSRFKLRKNSFLQGGS